MSVAAVKEYLSEFNLGERVREFNVSSATVELAAEALGTECARIAKTVSLKLLDGCVLLVTAGDTKIDNAKYKAFFHQKATMLSGEEVPALTGHPVGGVCPFANPEEAQVYCDTSLQRFETVFAAAGAPNAVVELSCEELFSASKAIAWIDACKARE